MTRPSENVLTCTMSGPYHITICPLNFLRRQVQSDGRNLSANENRAGVGSLVFPMFRGKNPKTTLLQKQHFHYGTENTEEDSLGRRSIPRVFHQTSLVCVLVLTPETPCGGPRPARNSITSWGCLANRNPSGRNTCHQHSDRGPVFESNSNSLLRL